MQKTALLISLVLVTAVVPTIAAHGSCTNAHPDGGAKLHLYGLAGSAGADSAAASGGAGATIVWDSNAVNCTTPPAAPDTFDGDLESGIGGAAAGFGPFATGCGYHTGGSNILVNDALGLATTFYVGADDQSGPLVNENATGCVTDGVIDGSNPNDCLHGPHVNSSVVSPCVGGGDGLVWVFIAAQVTVVGSNVDASATATGTVLFY